MNLGVTRIGKAGSALVRPPDGGGVRAAGVGREIEDVPVTAGRQHHGIGGVTADFAALQMAHDDPLGLPLHDHQIEHLGVGVGLDGSQANLPGQRRVGAQEKLLSGLSARIKGATDLRPAEGSVVEQPAVFAGEGHPLGHALVDDAGAHLGQSIDVGFPRPEVPAFDGVVEQAVNRVPVVRVVLRGVDATLRRDGMGASRAVVEDEVLHLIAQFAQSGCGRGPRQPGANDDDLVFPLVGRVDQFVLELALVPFLRQRAGRDVAVEARHTRFERHWTGLPAVRASPVDSAV